MKHLLLGVVLAMTALITLPVFAKAPASAEGAYEQGKAALKAGDTAGAIGAFKAGLGLAGGDEGRRWQLILALGLSYDRAGEPAHAIESYQRFLDQTKEHRAVLSPKWRNRRELVRGDIKGLEKRVAVSHGYVTVVTEPPGAQVFVGEERAGADGDALSPIGFYLPAGEHRVAVELQGHSRAEATVKLDPGKISPLRFTLELAGSTAGVTPPVKTTPVVSGVETLTLEVVVSDEVPVGPWIVIGSASALVLAAGITAGLAAGARADWDDYKVPGEIPPGDEREAYLQGWEEHRETVEGYELATITLASVGGAAAIGGLLWLLLDDGPATAEAPAVSVTPAPGGLVGHAAWRF